MKPKKGALPKLADAYKEASKVNHNFSVSAINNKLDKINLNTAHRNHPTQYIDLPRNPQHITSVRKVMRQCHQQSGSKNIDEGNYTFAFIGQRRTGKSFAARALLYEYRDCFDYGVVITGTKHNGFWQEFVPDMDIYELDKMNTVLNQVFEHQIRVKECLDNGIPVDFKPTFFVVLEDWIDNPLQTHYSPLVTQLFTTGRHYNICVIAITQYSKAINPKMRGNLDMAFIFRQNEESQKRAVWEDHLNELYRDDAYYIMRNWTMDFHCIAKIKMPYWQNIEEILFLWKAPETPKGFKLGCRQWWQKWEMKKQEQLSDMDLPGRLTKEERPWFNSDEDEDMEYENYYDYLTHLTS